MIVVIAGVVLWCACHWFKRIAPGHRVAMTERFGNGARGLIAAGIGISVLLMIFGYRMAPFVDVYVPATWTVHLNNLMMLLAVALLGAGSSKGRARSLFRHPMLIGVIVWAVAHLLVNGDVASLVLFGGIGAWAGISIVLINAAEPVWERPEPGPAKGDFRLALITLIIFCVIAGLHVFLGRWPFPG